jgi:hypothetical protein
LKYYYITNKLCKIISTKGLKMKKQIKILTLLIVILSLVILPFLLCDEDEESPYPTGKEHLLEGGWWNVDEYDGSYYDGNGGGYDLDGDQTSPVIDCADIVTYYFDGTTLTHCEDGTCITITLEFISDTEVEATVEGQTSTVVAVSVENTCN